MASLSNEEGFDPLCRFQSGRLDLPQLLLLPASSPHRTGEGLGLELLLRVGGEVQAHALLHGHQREVAVGDRLLDGVLDVADTQRVTEHAQ